MGLHIDCLHLEIRAPSTAARPDLAQVAHQQLLAGDDEGVALALAKERKTLDAATRSRLSEFLGDGFDDVMLFAGPMSGAIVRSLQAEALSQGRVILFDPSRFRTDSTQGEALLAHELTHARQFERGHDGSERHKEAEALAAEAAYLDFLQPGSLPLALDDAVAAPSPMDVSDPTSPWQQAAAAGAGGAGRRAHLGRQLKKAQGPRAGTADLEAKVAQVLVRVRDLLGQSNTTEEDRIGQLCRYFLGPL